VKAPAHAERAEAPAHGRLAAVWAVAKQTYQEFSKDNGTLMAAAVAFYILLSLVPMVLVALAIFGYVLGNAHAHHQVMQFVHQFLPSQDPRKDIVAGAIEAVQQARSTIGLIGLVSLLLTALGGFQTLETAINVQWRAPNRNFVWSKVFSLLMLLVVGGLLVLSLGITAGVEFASKLPPLRWMEGKWVAQTVGYVLPVFISGLMFTAVYKLFPNRRVPWKPAAIAGFVTALLWEAFKLSYTLYSTHSDLGKTYGTMASFVGLVVWIYYSCALIMLGSELTWVLAGCPDEAGNGETKGNGEMRKRGSGEMR